MDGDFTSLRVTVPEGGVYRISYWAVNKSNTPELKVVTTSSSSQVINDFSPDFIYTIVVDDWIGSVERGKQFPVLIVLLYHLSFAQDLTLNLCSILVLPEWACCRVTRFKLGTFDVVVHTYMLMPNI